MVVSATQDLSLKSITYLYIVFSYHPHPGPQ